MDLKTHTTHMESDPRARLIEVIEGAWTNEFDGDLTSSHAIADAILAASPPPPQVGSVFWVVSGGSLAQGGRKFSGPYSTAEDAFTARSSLEKLVPETFWVDSEDAAP